MIVKLQEHFQGYPLFGFSSFTDPFWEICVVQNLYFRTEMGKSRLFQVTSHVKSIEITIQVMSSQVMTESKIYYIKSSQVASQLEIFKSNQSSQK
jgi:hypothetical protein